MSAIFGATAKRLSTTLAIGIAPDEHVLAACWYNRTVGATVFDDKLLELKSANIATGGQLRVENTTGPTISPRQFAAHPDDRPSRPPLWKREYGVLLAVIARLRRMYRAM